jgi:hypothetical protein
MLNPLRKVQNGARHCEPRFRNSKLMNQHVYAWRSNLPEQAQHTQATLSKHTPFHEDRLLRPL